MTCVYCLILAPLSAILRLLHTAVITCHSSRLINQQNNVDASQRTIFANNPTLERIVIVRNIFTLFYDNCKLNVYFHYVSKTVFVTNVTAMKIRTVAYTVIVFMIVYVYKTFAFLNKNPKKTEIVY